MRKIVNDKDSQLNTMTNRLNCEINTKVTNLENLLHEKDIKLREFEMKFDELQKYVQLEENYNTLQNKHVLVSEENFILKNESDE